MTGKNRPYYITGRGAVAALLLLLNVVTAGSALSRERVNVSNAGLDQCLAEALENNRRRPASRYAVDMARARHRQVLAGYWPQVTAQAGFSRMDEPVTFQYPATAVVLPPEMGGMSFTMPGQELDIVNEKSYTATLEATWLLYDGGMRKGYGQQAQGLVDIMTQEVRRTDLEIIDSVKRYYWGAVMAGGLYRLGQDTLARMTATLNLTESMYKQGSGRVKKTDWLSNKVMVESLRSMVALLEKNMLTAQAVLANTMGLNWDRQVKPEDEALPFTALNIDTAVLVEGAYRFNPDWAKVEAGLKAAEGGLLTAKSGHCPKLALTGNLHRWWPENDGGLATEANKTGWTLGVGVSIPIFSGMATTYKIAAARAAVAKLKEEQLLLKSGIGLQIQDIILSLVTAEKAVNATRSALDAATENRGLNVRAYQNELVETDDVVKAQLMEALMAAQHYKVQYEHVALLSRLDLIVGTEVQKKFR